MKIVKQSYTIHAPVEKVWKALVDPKEIDGWGGGPAVMDEKVGTKFKLWGGDIHGKNVEVVSQKKLVQEWYGGEWEEPSLLTFHLHIKNADTTIVDLLHEKIPDEEAKDIEQGWKDYYMNPLKEFVEAGCFVSGNLSFRILGSLNFRSDLHDKILRKENMRILSVDLVS